MTRIISNYRSYLKAKIEAITKVCPIDKGYARFSGQDFGKDS